MKTNLNCVKPDLKILNIFYHFCCASKFGFYVIVHPSQKLTFFSIKDQQTHFVQNMYSICIGNHRMDESAIWEKIARQQKNYTRRSRVLFELL